MSMPGSFAQKPERKSYIDTILAGFIRRIPNNRLSG